MIETLTGNVQQLSAEVESALAAYRHSIFIEKLGWQLPIEDGLERDQFDADDTVYVINRTHDGDICGCGRLLPTTRPYLLSEVFAGLLGGAPVPRAADVWELSRFSASFTKGRDVDAATLAHNTYVLLAAVVRAALDLGARRLVTVSPLGIERILRRMGVHAHRAAAPSLVDGKPVFACWIELDEQTTQALGISRECIDVPARNSARPRGAVRTEQPLPA